jgi:hypothetical protein
MHIDYSLQERTVSNHFMKRFVKDFTGITCKEEPTFELQASALPAAAASGTAVTISQQAHAFVKQEAASATAVTATTTTAAVSDATTSAAATVENSSSATTATAMTTHDAKRHALEQTAAAASTVLCATTL